jgi:polyphenol oxidase
MVPVDWPAAAGVRAVMTTRHGGVSLPPFDSFNLGNHVQDDATHVALNRQRLGRALGARPVFLQQVHGTRCVSLDDHTPDGTVADACATRQPGVVCTVMVADCLPVLLVDAAGRTVAAAHAGWRGLAGAGEGCGGDCEGGGEGVLESVFKHFSALSLMNNEQFATDKNSVTAWLGPCIGPTEFEVGAEVRAAFLDSDLPTAAVNACFERVPGTSDKYLAHLAALARLRLSRLGVTSVWGNDGSPAWCTVTQASLWFSHRRDAARLGSTGRMAACIWLDGV